MLITFKLTIDRNKIQKELKRNENFLDNYYLHYIYCKILFANNYFILFVGIFTMASIFSVHQTYKSQLDLYKKVDQYEKETGYKLMVFDSHTIDTVAKKTKKRMHSEKIILYEAYFRCKKGKKENCTEKKKEDEEEEETENL